MQRLILKRIIFLIPILIGISMISFLITSLSPSDPAEVAIRVNAMVPTPELIAETRSEMGLDRPIAVRWVNWITSALHGDLGRRTPCRGGIFRGASRHTETRGRSARHHHSSLSSMRRGLRVTRGRQNGSPDPICGLRPFLSP